MLCLLYPVYLTIHMKETIAGIVDISQRYKRMSGLCYALCMKSVMPSYLQETIKLYISQIYGRMNELYHAIFNLYTSLLI